MPRIVVELGPHRKHVTVTPLTKVVDIIKDACSQLGVAEDRYLLRHGKIELAGDQIWRMLNIGPGSRLQLVENMFYNIDATVHVVFQVQGSQRVEVDAPCSTSLASLLPQTLLEAHAGSWPRLRYMSTIVSGKELESTTLKSLGIMHGTAPFKVDFSPNHAPFASDVSDTPPLVQQSNNSIPPPPAKERISSPVQASASESLPLLPTDSVEPPSLMPALGAVRVYKCAALPEHSSYPGRSIGSDEHDDESFFHVTAADVKYMQSALTRKVQTLENAPLQFKSRRNDQTDRQDNESDSLEVRVRIQFPDRNLLEVSTLAQSTLGQLYDTILPFLADASLSEVMQSYMLPNNSVRRGFSLHMRPPVRHLRDMQATLLQEKISSNTLLFFSYDSDYAGDKQVYLSEDALSKAEYLQSSSTMGRGQVPAGGADGHEAQHSVTSAQPIPPAQANANTSSTAVGTSAKGKEMPKWFKKGFH